MKKNITLEKVWQLLEDVHDPEIPVVSVVEMGMIRSVGLENGKAIVTMTPTFAGCPAIPMIQDEIKTRLQKEGTEGVEIRTVLSPPWSTDWVTQEGRQKLKSFGISPPPRHKGLLEQVLLEPVPCPYCDSKNTEMKNNFGPALCRAIYYCNDCQQPFERFKPL